MECASLTWHWTQVGFLVPFPCHQLVWVFSCMSDGNHMWADVLVRLLIRPVQVLGKGVSWARLCTSLQDAYALVEGSCSIGIEMTNCQSAVLFLLTALGFRGRWPSALSVLAALPTA